jgi:hypothetical protein
MALKVISQILSMRREVHQFEDPGLAAPFGEAHLSQTVLNR